jgi:hypothetical protein
MLAVAVLGFVPTLPSVAQILPGAPVAPLRSTGARAAMSAGAI